MSESGRILVVDDEPQMRLAMTRVLRRAGYRVEEACDGLDALEKLRRDPHDLVVSDVRMPRMDGVEFLTRARTVAPGTEILLMTAYGTVETAVEAVRLGARDYILKPFPPEVLERAVHEALRAGLQRDEETGGSADKRLLTDDPVMLELLERAGRAARSEATVLIEAESGTGKELLARHIHRESARARGPFSAVNCAAFPGDLLEAELFGHARGAFTGAVRERRGHFECAAGGTLLLDEVADMPLAMQAKLLRVIQEREVQRLGDETVRRVDVRVLASTNRDLAGDVAAGRFREDLYFRLSVIPLRIPPLRERPADIPLLARHFCRLHGARTGHSLGEAAIGRLLAHSWPGNVRELENVILRAVVLSAQPEIGPDGLLPGLPSMPARAGASAGTAPGAVVRASAAVPVLSAGAAGRGVTIEQAERVLIEDALRSTNGNRERAAELLGISVRTVRNRLRSWREAEGRQELPSGS